MQLMYSVRFGACVPALGELKRRLCMLASRILKKDIFGEVRFVSSPDGDMIVRDASSARPWIGWLARLLLRREAKVLALLGSCAGLPELLASTPDRLHREYIPGLPLHQGNRPGQDYFTQARRLLRELHRAGVVHNDLAKEPNLLITDSGDPALVDFQLAWSSPNRGRLFRALAYEDIRHLLKHKRSYCPQLLTARERHILENPHCVSRTWMKSGKPVYLFVTRRLLHWSDREGAGDRGEK